MERLSNLHKQLLLKLPKHLDFNMTAFIKYSGIHPHEYHIAVGAYSHTGKIVFGSSQTDLK